MKKEKSNKKLTVKDIVLLSCATLMLVAFIASNIVIAVFQDDLTNLISGWEGSSVTSNEVQQAYLDGESLVQSVEEDSIVMLKNDGALPLAKGTKLNLFGYNSTDKGFLITGGGTGGVNVVDTKKVTLKRALESAGVEYNPTLMAAYEGYSNYDMDNSQYNSQGAEAVLVNPPASFYTEELMNGAREYSDTAVIVLSRFTKENGFPAWSTIRQDKMNPNIAEAHFGNEYDDTRHYLQTSVEEDIMISKVCEKFADGNVIVIVNSCVTMELSFCDNAAVDAVFSVGIPGCVGARAIPRVMYGDVNPSGRLADTHVYHSEDAPSFANGTYVNTSHNTRPQTIPGMEAYKDNLHYMEGIYAGYKWYETAFAQQTQLTVNERTLDFSTENGYKQIVQYPFGYGLSYTDFSWEIVSAPNDGSVMTDENEKFEIKVRVTNTGTKAGADVVQLYYTPPYISGGIEKSAVNLLAFAKTPVLKPANLTDDGIAESAVVTLGFSAYDMASYDCYDSNGNEEATYELDAGSYALTLRTDAHTLADMTKNTVTLSVSGTSSEDAVLLILDPVTEELVENRFTGSDAYAGIPLDGSTVHESIAYMSRSDFANTFPYARQANPSSAFAKNSYVYDDFGTVSAVEYEKDNGLKLTYTENNELKYNEELMRELYRDEYSSKWNDLLSQISSKETEDLLKLGGFKTNAVNSFGLPRLNDTDGPGGFGKPQSPGTAMEFSLPSESTIATSWNVIDSYMIGKSQGALANKQGLGGWYAPCVNIHRSPFGARNHESYSEDPVLSGKMAASLIEGGKKSGLRCYIKHFALDETGHNPRQQSVWLTEQALREIYLKPFEIGVKEGGANAIMSSFNYLGSEWSGANRALMTDILRTEWGFKGVAITDWAGDYMHAERGLRAGNDLWLGNGGAGWNGADINRNAANAMSARLAVKHIVYSYIDNYITAKDFAASGADDKFSVDIDKVLVSEKPYSPLFTAMWAVLDTLLLIGILLLVFFVVFPKWRKKHAKQKQENTSVLSDEKFDFVTDDSLFDSAQSSIKADNEKKEPSDGAPKDSE